MSAKRIVKNAGPLGSTFTRPQAAELAREIVEKQLEQERLVAERDSEVLRVSAPYAAKIESLAREVEHSLDILEAWAAAHLEEFGKAESLLLDGHRVGWRLGNYQAKPANTKTTWAKIQTAIEGLPRKFQELFLRPKVDVNKQALIDAREEHADVLAGIGVRIVQERRFYLDPDREGQAEKLLTQPAA